MPDIYKTFDDVLIKPRYSDIESRDDVSLAVKWNIERLRKSYRFKTPICNASMDTISSVNMALTLDSIGALPTFHRNCPPEAQANTIKKFREHFDDDTIHFCAAAVGVNDYQKRLEILELDEFDFVLIDVAHGHHINVKRMVEWLHVNMPRNPIISGSIATAHAARDCFDWGIDVLRVGIGPGATCSTRIKTGIGVPQLAAIQEVVSITDKYGLPVISDGGIRTSGDAFKAFAAGADMVMMGSYLAGTSDTPSSKYEIDGVMYADFRGMASRAVGVELSGRDAKNVYDEGVSGMVKYKGETIDVINDLLHGLKSGCSYVGVDKLSMVHAVAEFIDVSTSSVNESNPHDIMFLK